MRSNRAMRRRKGKSFNCGTHRGFHTSLGRGDPCTQCQERREVYQDALKSRDDDSSDD